jgi:sulfite reductase beta subunit-like hemoprotein
VEKAGLEWRASSIRAGLIACTGSRGCRFSAADTKTHAEDIADWCEARVTLDQPVNIHLTGCHHSCAQHYIGDIGLVAARVSVNEEGDTVDGYHIVAGGGFGAAGAIGREILRDVKAEDAPAPPRAFKIFPRGTRRQHVRRVEMAGHQLGAVARSNLAARRADEARRWPPSAAAHDGRDGAAGLRSMRL